MNPISAIGNDWAKNPRRAGFKRSITFQVGGDGQSVLVRCMREGGSLMVLNFSKNDALRFQIELELAISVPSPGYDPHDILDRGDKRFAAAGGAA